jgi:hypothetical protein
MKPFFGRAQELSELDATARLPGAKFIVIKGRRRVGKSRLAQEFGKRHPDMALYYLTGLPPSDPPAAQRERENFASQLSRVFKIPKPTSDNWDELLWHLADRVKSGNAILVLDEINWIGHADRKFSSKLWALWETELSGLSNFILILSGSLAGWIDDQFSSHTGYLGRISWNTTLDELPLRDALLFFGVRRARISIYEQLTILLITGGIPRYLEEIDPRQTAEENIKRLCFSQAGLLFNEYDQLMNDLFQGRNKIYRDIIEALTEHLPDAPPRLESPHRSALQSVQNTHHRQLRAILSQGDPAGCRTHQGGPRHAAGKSLRRSRPAIRKSGLEEQAPAAVGAGGAAGRDRQGRPLFSKPHHQACRLPD